VLATGAELSRRGYDVTFTLGNTRRVDMLCSVPDGDTFKVQVKGISGTYSFYIDKSFFEGVQPDLFLVIGWVSPPGDGSPFRYFGLRHEEAKREFAKLRTHKKDGRPYTSGHGLNWGSIKQYEMDTWSKFPAIP